MAVYANIIKFNSNGGGYKLFYTFQPRLGLPCTLFHSMSFRGGSALCVPLRLGLPLPYTSATSVAGISNPQILKSLNLKS